MKTFVLLIFFWEGARGYSIATVPGYENFEACKTAQIQVTTGDPPTSSYSRLHAICIMGPAVPRREGQSSYTPG